MNASAYESLFRGLGCSSWEKRHRLAHPSGMPSIYFNVAHDEVVYFAVRAAERHAFRGDLWQEIPARQRKDDKPTLRTLVPQQGRELEAFRSVIGWPR